MTKTRKPCQSCGKTVVSAAAGEAKCQSCRRVTRDELQAERDEKAAERAAKAESESRVDWLVVEWVCQSSHARPILTSAERRMVVRRLAHRIAGNVEIEAGLRPGRLSAGDVGNRIGTSSYAVWKIIERLPAATRHRCPDCCGDMWVIDATGTVEDHGNGYLEQCVMVGQTWLAVSA